MSKGPGEEKTGHYSARMILFHLDARKMRSETVPSKASLGAFYISVDRKQTLQSSLPPEMSQLRSLQTPRGPSN